MPCYSCFAPTMIPDPPPSAAHPPATVPPRRDHTVPVLISTRRTERLCHREAHCAQNARHAGTEMPCQFTVDGASVSVAQIEHRTYAAGATNPAAIAKLLGDQPLFGRSESGATVHLKERVEAIRVTIRLVNPLFDLRWKPPKFPQGRQGVMCCGTRKRRGDYVPCVRVRRVRFAERNDQQRWRGRAF